MRRPLCFAAAAAAFLLGAPAPAGVTCGLDVQNVTPDFSPDGTRLVFVSGGMGGCSEFGSLMLASTAGGLPRDLLAGATAERPRFSPDGRLIAASVFRGGAGADPAIEVVTLDGESRRLAEGVQPAWSPDGAELAFAIISREGPAETWAVRPDGSGRRRVASGRMPSWSPDGTRIALREIVGVDAGVSVVDRSGANRRFISRRVGYSRLLWSPDSRSLAYRDEDVLVVADVETGASREFRGRAAGTPIAWSPGGHRILLQGGLAVDADDGDLHRPFGAVSVEGVSRDWRRYAVAVEAGRYFGYAGNDLYVLDVLGSGARLVSPLRCAPPTRDCREGTDLEDTLRAAAPVDWLRGLAGHDSLVGSNAFDRIEAAFGDDDVFGRGGNDHLFGGPGRDRVWGDDGDDYIDGGPGHDVIVSGRGRGRIHAGPGDDRIDARAGRRTAVWCGDGVDVVRANATVRTARDCERVSSRGA